MRVCGRRWWSYGLAALAILAGAAALGPPAAADARPTASVEPAPGAPAAPPVGDRVLQAPLVVLGIGGLGWDDVSPERTPTLWSLLEGNASVAAVTVHTSGQPACPSGGWLSLSAGRAATSERFGGMCVGMPEVRPAGSAASVPGWFELATEQRNSLYGPEIGTLGTVLADAGVCATAVGPGAALALADDRGQVERYFSRPTAAAFGCPLTVVDLGVTSVVADAGDGALPIDEKVAAALAQVPSGTTVLLTSVATTVGDRLEMGVSIVAGPATSSELLSTASTRRAGVIRLLDLPSSLVDTLGVAEPSRFQGAPVVAAGPRDDAETVVARLADISVADYGLRRAATPLLDTLGLGSIALVLGAVLLLRRRPGTAAPRRALEMGLLVLASAPLASYLVTALQWWRFGEPRLALWLGMGGIAVLLAGAVYLLPRRPVWRAALGLSLVTTVVLVLDAIMGAPLHWGSPLGTSAVLGNRYYGFGNSTYAVFAVHTIVLAGVLAARYVAAERRRAAVFAVVAVGAVTVLVDIWPTWGADVGGGLALVPAFGLLALGVAGQRVTPTRALLVLGGGVVVVAAVSVLDWMRAPSQRSHAGQFVQQVIDGRAWDLLGRKIDYAVASLDRGPSAWLTLLGLALAAAVVIRPDRFSPRALDAAAAQWPGLRATLGALLVSAVLGSLVNDWGIRVATVVLTAALPLVAAICLRALDQRPSTDRTVARSSTTMTTPQTSTATEPARVPPSTAPAKSAAANRSPTR